MKKTQSVSFREFQRRFVVLSPLADVVQFHRDATALKKLTPPPIFVQLHQVQPLSENSIADFTMWIGPIPVHWVARHQDVDPQQGFSDIQVSGPFESWIHKHQFIQRSDGATEIIDEIKAEPGKGFYKGLISRMMWLGLPFLFWYRSWGTRRSLENR